MSILKIVKVVSKLVRECCFANMKCAVPIKVHVLLSMTLHKPVDLFKISTIH